MADYAANCPVSGPISLPDIVPDVHLNGVSFSYDYGLIYHAPEEEVPLRPPNFIFGPSTS